MSTKEIRKNINELFRSHLRRAANNLGRASSLLQLYYDLNKGKRGRKRTEQTDILRSAVVFLHATLEDYLRSVASVYLPQANAESLNDIPLLGSTDTGRAEKFSLGKLSSFRGKTVEEVITESVHSHLSRTSFNNIHDIVHLLTSMSISTKRIEQYFPELEKMIKRRHQIVHNADLMERPFKGVQKPSSIDYAQVKKWINTLTGFTSSLMAELINTKT